MMRQILLLMIAVFGSMLVGCGRDWRDTEAEKAAAIHKMLNPPPIPPNCPINPQNLTDEVRVIRRGDIALFIPKNWLDGYFVDEAMKRYAATIASIQPMLQKFVPDIHSVECPGTVHVLKPNVRAASYGDFAVGPTGIAEGHALSNNLINVKQIFFSFYPVERSIRSRPNYSGEGFAGNLDGLSWKAENSYVYVDQQGDQRPCRVSIGNPRSGITIFRQLNSDVYAGFVIDRDDARPSRWRDYCAHLAPVFDWLTKNPAAR